VPPPEGQWFDSDAGPVVRPYALTAGLSRPDTERLDMLSLVCAVRGAAVDPLQLSPEQLTLLRRCQVPVPAADLASDMDLPLGVIRILIGDLSERGLVTIHTASPARLADPQLLRAVADGLRRI
jgi:hypothetical protein